MNREANDNREEDCDADEKSGGEADGGELHLAHVLEHKRVVNISAQSKTIVHLRRYINTQLPDNRAQCSRGREFLEGRSRWNALSEGLGARLADHEVYPSGVEASEDNIDAGHAYDADKKAVTDQGGNGSSKDVQEEDVEGEELEAPEAGEEASTGAKIPNSRAKVGGYGLLLDEEKFLLDAV